MSDTVLDFCLCDINYTADAADVFFPVVVNHPDRLNELSDN